MKTLDQVRSDLRSGTAFYGRLSGMALADATVAEVVAALTTVTALQELSRTIATNAQLSQLLGSAWEGEWTDLDPIVDSLSWADQINSRSASFCNTGSWMVAKDTVSRAAEARAFAKVAAPALIRATALLERLSSWGSATPYPSGG